MWKNRRPGRALVALVSFTLALSCNGSALLVSPLDSGLFNGPGGPAPAPAPARWAYVGHGYSEDVDVVDLIAMTVAGTITGAGGYRMVLNPAGTKLYGTGGDSSVYISNTQTRLLITSFNPGANYPTISVSELEAIAISPDGSRVYVFDEQGSTAVFVINTATDTVINAAPLALDEPENAVVSPDGAFVYVSDNSVVAKINTTTLQIADTVPCGSDCHGLAINASGTRLYVKGVTGGIDVIDTATMNLVTNINDASNFSNGGYYITLSADGARVYSVDEGASLFVINTANNTLIQNVTTSLTNVRGVITTPDSATVLVATGQGLLKLNSATLSETGTLTNKYYQSVVVAKP